MIKSRKGLVLETLLRLVIAGVLIYIVVFKVGKPVAETVFGGNNLKDSFNKFVDDINKQELGSKQAIVYLEKDTSIIGFSKNTDSFKCIGCGIINSNDVSSKFKKPENKDCNGKPCVCLCPKQLQAAQPKLSQNLFPYEIKCSTNLFCKPLDSDLVNEVQLKEYIEELEKKGFYVSSLKSGRWSDGFLFERHSSNDYSSYFINNLPQSQNSKFTLFVKKENFNGQTFIEVCPGPKCSSSIKDAQEQNTKSIINS